MHLMTDDLFADKPPPHQPKEGTDSHLEDLGKSYDLRPKPLHHPATATSVIQLFMNGGPSQMDLFDPKPELAKLDGKPYPGSVEEIGNTSVTDIGVMMGGQYPIKRHGESGMWMANTLPHTSQMVDDICLINSMWTDHPNHDNALYKIHSGRLFMGYPTLGAWTAYGLGSENQNLPAYVVLGDPLGLPKNGTRNWTAGFLPPVYQGTPFRPTGSPILNLSKQYKQPADVSATASELLKTLDKIHRSKRPHRQDLDARIESYGLAARMQLTANEALDLNRENAETLRLYGVGKANTDSYGKRCLMARRLVERGVRFVQVWHGAGQPWDSHSEIAKNHGKLGQEADQPIAALLTDLKQRGLLEDTLVIWGGEFGRTPMAQGNGRDHHIKGFSMWLAGGGVKKGASYGETDPLGYHAVKDIVHVRDLHATILHLFGINHAKFTVPFQGLDMKLTGVKPARVAHGILS